MSLLPEESKGVDLRWSFFSERGEYEKGMNSFIEKRFSPLIKFYQLFKVEQLFVVKINPKV